MDIYLLGLRHNLRHHGLPEPSLEAAFTKAQGN